MRYHDSGEDRTLADVREYASKMAQNLKMEAARRKEIASRGRGNQQFNNNNNRRGFGRYNRNNFQSRSMSNARNNRSVEVNQEISEAAQEAEAGYLEAKAKGL